MRTVPAGDQAGSSLIVAIVFLLLLSTLALAALRSSTSNVQVVGNMQARQEAQAAAQMLIERLISTDEFALDPVEVMAAGPTVADINGDGKPDVIARLVPNTGVKCIGARPVLLQDLDPTIPTDAVCFGSATVANPGIVPIAGAP